MKNAANRYLWFRPESRNIWFRMAVPREVQGRVGRKPILCSLGTADRRQALILAGKKRAELFEEWGLMPKAKEAAPVIDPASLGVRIGFDDMIAAMEERRKAWPADDAEYAVRLAEREATLRRLTRRLHDGDLSEWEAVADRAIAGRELPFEKGSEAYAALVQALAEGSIDAVGTFTRRHGGELNAEPQSTVVQEAKAKEAAKAKPGETIMELFERWASEVLDKGDKRADTVNQDRKVIQQFAAFVGVDRDMRSIKPDEVFEYRETLRALPPKWTTKRELRGLHMRTAASKARELDLPKTAFTTVNKHLSTISPLYRWLRGQPKWSGLGNPCDGLFYAKVKGKNARPPFSTAMLNQILTSPLFTGFLSDDREHVAGNMRADDWRKWIPLVAMFTGARIGEIAQLRIGDVNRQHGVWFVHIRHEEGEGLTTKSGKSRFAAVHSMLGRIGFLDFHARRLKAAGGDLSAPLFPELEPNARGQISGTPSRWWRDYLSAIGVKDGADGYGAHSFRHTLADRLRDEADLLDDKIAVVLGHSIKTTTSGYGTVPQGTVPMFKAWMEAVRFEGVDFTHLIADADALKVV
ncbi:tyrosine-type recombinase/integrase [Sphingomonas sp. MG17]|uniref:Tyrosine-type recombinase/integrase n=1 Tax=Sphingomonas tagetis TaxID=2949092 RepID=A0A9X2KQI6_9SPHN|nr:tyrosine-type recombinase/integrase [Sphingomonas tagetis]MCP3731803.1 tyrosine-type recombinase/integrase [Sphingomonas tagetis]